MKEWKESHPGAPIKEAMSEVCTRIYASVFCLTQSFEIAAMWRDAPENPNRGKEPKARKPKEPGAPKVSRKKKKKETPPPSSDAENSAEASE
jgi:hypothetical protein